MKNLFASFIVAALVAVAATIGRGVRTRLAAIQK